MVQYKQMILATPEMLVNDMIKLLRGLVKKAWEGGGLVRRIENKGVQPLAYSIKDTKSVRGQVLHHTEARMLSVHYEVAPSAIQQIDRDLRLDEKILRVTTLKEKNDPLASVQSIQDKRTWQPYTQKYLKKREEDASEMYKIDRESYISWRTRIDRPNDVYETDYRIYGETIGHAHENPDLQAAEERYETLVDELREDPFEGFSAEDWQSLKEPMFEAASDAVDVANEDEETKRIREERRKAVALSSAAASKLINLSYYVERRPKSLEEEAMSNDDIHAEALQPNQDFHPDLNDPLLADKTFYLHSAMRARNSRHRDNIPRVAVDSQGVVDDLDLFDPTGGSNDLDDLITGDESTMDADTWEQTARQSLNGYMGEVVYSGSQDHDEDLFNAMQAKLSNKNKIPALKEKSQAKLLQKQTMLVQYLKESQLSPHELNRLTEEEKAALVDPVFLQAEFNQLAFSDNQEEIPLLSNGIQYNTDSMPSEELAEQVMGDIIAKKEEEFRKKRVKVALERKDPDALRWLDREIEKYGKDD